MAKGCRSSDPQGQVVATRTAAGSPRHRSDRLSDTDVRLTILGDPGYAIVPRLLGIVPAEAIDAVLVSHGHPDHVADLNRLLRARYMSDMPPPPLPAYALPEALTPVLALEQIGSLTSTCDVRGFKAGESFKFGPFAIAHLLLTHLMPGTDHEASRVAASRSYDGSIEMAMPGSTVEVP